MDQSSVGRQTRVATMIGLNMHIRESVFEVQTQTLTQTPTQKQVLHKHVRFYHDLGFAFEKRQDEGKHRCWLKDRMENQRNTGTHDSGICTNGRLENVYEDGHSRKQEKDEYNQ